MDCVKKIIVLVFLSLVINCCKQSENISVTESKIIFPKKDFIKVDKCGSVKIVVQNRRVSKSEELKVLLNDSILSGNRPSDKVFKTELDPQYKDTGIHTLKAVVKSGKERLVSYKTIKVNSFNTNYLPGDSIYGINGQRYGTVKIHDQCWMSENLNTGELIQKEERSENNEIIEKYCYNNNKDLCKKYGGLYQWKEAIRYNRENEQDICPQGWHLPSKKEWQRLKRNLGKKPAIKLASPSWYEAGFSSSETGFNALPAGIRRKKNFGDSLVYFSRFEEETWFWTSTKSGSSFSNFVSLYDKKLDISITFIRSGLSVRCIKSDI